MFPKRHGPSLETRKGKRIIWSKVASSRSSPPLQTPFCSPNIVKKRGQHHKTLCSPHSIYSVWASTPWFQLHNHIPAALTYLTISYSAIIQTKQELGNKLVQPLRAAKQNTEDKHSHTHTHTNIQLPSVRFTCSGQWATTGTLWFPNLASLKYRLKHESLTRSDVCCHDQCMCTIWGNH